jgi:predicted cupin superfamily sugar epimerase
MIMADLPSLKTVVDKLGLIPHPVEGGYFREVYRSAEGTLHASLPMRFNGDRDFATSIYYVIPPGQISSLHLMFADETWHFYLGSPIKLVEISPTGEVTETIMGPDIAAGQVPQHTVMHGNWLGAWNLEESLYSLVGCTVAPGMELHDYQHGERDDLLKLFPQHKDLIMRLTWAGDKPPPPPYVPHHG